MSLPLNQAWFPAKKYGWGWSLPQRWQGWMVLLGLIVGVAVGALLAHWGLVFLLTYYSVLLAGLILICLWKGESPHWRWGGDEPPPGSNPE